MVCHRAFRMVPMPVTGAMIVTRRTRAMIVTRAMAVTRALACHRWSKPATAAEKFGLADVQDTSAMNGDTAKLLVTRMVRATFPGSDDPDTVYHGIVKRVHSAEEAGMEGTVWLLACFEDGEEQSYSMADILLMLVPFASMKPRLELLLKVR